jgi:hypothetical protein
MKAMINEYRSRGLDDGEVSQRLTDHFRRGVLVEYKDLRGFYEEFGRARVDSVQVEGDQLRVEPGEKIEGPRRGASMVVDDFNTIAERQVDGVIYMNVPNMWCYAICPPSTEIPKPHELKF